MIRSAFRIPVLPIVAVVSLGVGLEAAPADGLLLCAKIDKVTGAAKDGSPIRLREACKTKRDGTPLEVAVGSTDDLGDIAGKADQSAVDANTAAIAGKADQSAVDANAAAIAGKAAQSAVDANTTAIAGKADQSAVDANTTAIAGKAAQSAVDANTAAIAGKAAQSAVDVNTTAIAGKTDQVDHDALESRVTQLELIAPQALDRADDAFVVDGRKFVIVDEQMSASEGQAVCEEFGMDLAKVETPAQNLAISDWWGFDRPNTLIWIGANDVDVEGTLVHRDGTTVDDSWVLWYDLVNLPNSNSRDCVSLSGRFTFRTQGQVPYDLWGHENCINTRYIVCSD